MKKQFGGSGRYFLAFAVFCILLVLGISLILATGYAALISK